MPQSLSVVYLHIVFSTKGREPFLQNPQLRGELHRWLGRASGELNCPAEIIGGVADHVHILARQSRTISQADWIKELKRTSSAWIKQRDPKLQKFAWQAGYGVFSVSASDLDGIRDYVLNQEEHHKKWTFQDELRARLKSHGEEWDEKYVWD